MGIEDQLLDTVVRREIVASRLRRQIDGEIVTETNIATATALLEEVRKLNRADKLLESIQRREATFGSHQKSVQRRIDLLFAGLRSSIREAISPAYVTDLEDAIEQARLRLPRQAAKAP